MDIPDEKGKTSEKHRLDFLSAVLHFLPGIIRRMIAFFTVTEADRMKAGIFIRRRGA
jgi:hypothetical protein